MKKIKSIISYTIIICTICMSILPTYAVDIPVYESTNPEYKEMIDSFDHILPYEQEIVEWINSYSPDLPDEFDIKTVKHIYSPFSEEEYIGTYITDCEWQFRPHLVKARKFEGYSIDWSLIYSTDELFYENHSVEELNEFLYVNGLTSYFEKDEDDKKYYIRYKEGTTEKEMILTFLLLKEEYDMTIQLSTLGYRSGNLYETTLSGDFNLDGIQGVSDVVAMTKYNINPYLYSNIDNIAFANADMDSSGRINSTDVNYFMEILLNSFESAV